MRVLPGRPKRNRKIDPQEQKEKAERAAAERKKTRAEVKKGKRLKTGKVEEFKLSRKGQANHCKICGKQYHNSKTCPNNIMEEEGTSQANQEQQTAEVEEQRDEGDQEPSVPHTQPDDPPRMQTRSRTKRARLG